MPRPPSTSKRHQGAANVRDTRHDNGLVGPGKRVQRQKSSGLMNGHANANSSDSIPSTPPPPATPPPMNGNARLPSPADNTSDHNIPENMARKTSISGNSDSSSDAYSPPTLVFPPENHRHINVNTAKNSSVHRDAGPWTYASTVLRSCPLGDTLAILIVLLQIPPTFLSIIQLLFATLTFVPPSSTVNNGLSFTDIFEGTLGTPSLATIVVVDAVFLLIWLFLWSPLQDFVLQFAQSVIALTLGGGISGKQTGFKNVFLCFGVISASHYFRNGSINIKSAGLRAVLSSPRGLFGSSDSDDPLEPISQNYSAKVPEGWIRSGLAIHILTQGVVRYIRDWYVRREKRDNSASNIGDPEAAKGSADGNNDSSTTSSQTHDAESPLHVSNTNVTSRKKRKQSAQVRIQQPLWAALASTKIVMVKEYETSHAAAESAGSNATDPNNLGDAPFSTEADRIWITHVGSDEVSFSTSHFSNHKYSEKEHDGNKDTETSNQPFFIRVNQTHWQPTKMKVNIDTSLPVGQNTCWSGEICGLAPLNNYKCEFVSKADDSVICSTSVRTLPVPSDAAAAVALSPLPPQVSGRPGSPSTTIKASIASSEAKLVEERNRQKRERKEQRTKVATLRKDLERLGNSLATVGSNDDRLRQKIQQINLHIKQAEDATASLQSEIDAIEKLPSSTSDPSYISSKAAYRTQKEQHDKFKTEFAQHKTKQAQTIASLSGEVQTLVGKCERSYARSIKLSEQYDRLMEAKEKDMDESERRARERSLKEAERSQKKHLWVEADEKYMQEIEQITKLLHELYSEMERIHLTWEALQQEAVASTAWTTEASMAAFPAYAPIMGMQGAMPNSISPGVIGSTSRARGRSSSMLSNESGFTQASDDDITAFYGPQNQYNSNSTPYKQSQSPFGPSFRPTPTHQSYSDPSTLTYQPQLPRKGSSGSGNSASVHQSGFINLAPGSGSGSGSSIADPKSPIPGNAALQQGMGFGVIGNGSLRMGSGHLGSGSGGGNGNLNGNGRGIWDN